MGHSPRDGKEADMTEQLSMPVSGFGKTAQTLVCAGLMCALVCSKRKWRWVRLLAFILNILVSS